MKFPRKIFTNALIFSWLTILILPIHLKAQVKSPGKIAGRILDATSNEPLFGAVAFIRISNTAATSDFDGKFQLTVAPGLYELEVKMIGYQTKLYNKVQVNPGETNLLTIYLKEQSVETQTVEIVADVSTDNDNALLKEQKASNSINSGVTAELLSKTPDRNLSESFKRISGTSIREGKFAMVRGLSERYNMGQLNGVSIPSTESDRKAFNLELFPSNLIDKIVVSKTATPDQPGDIAGGLIKIQTLDIPFSNSFQGTVGIENHSLTTGKRFETIKQSPTDWLGFDNGLRRIPNGALTTEDYFTNQDQQLKSRQSLVFNHKVVPNQKNAGPNVSAQFSLGRRGKVFGKTAGLVASVNYYQTKVRNQFFYYFPTFSTGKPITEYSSTEQDRYRINSSLSTVLNFSIKPNASTKLSLRNFYSQTGSNLSQFSNSVTINKLDDFSSDYVEKKTILSFYEQNSLVSSQFAFEKYVGSEGGKIEFLIGGNYLNRNTPDYSRLLYDRSGLDSLNKPKKERFVATLGNLPPVSFSQDLSGKFFSALTEHSIAPSLNFTWPFKILKIKNQFKTGVLYQERDRIFEGRNYLYTKGNSAGAILSLPPDSIFRNENFGAELLTLTETTLNSDFYDATTRLSAGYLMNETFFDSKGSRIIYGIRYESYFQSITSAAVAKGPRLLNETTVADWFPSVNVNVNASRKFVVRAAFSRTVNRPELRELAAFTFFEPSQNAYFYGNPKLVRARVQNADLKFEFYPNEISFIALNGFHKTFDDPIEVTRGFTNTLPTFTYSNRDEAKSYGLELEGKVKFQILDSLLKTTFFSKWSVFANFALIRSEVSYKQRNFKRPIHGQSPYVFNAGIQYSNNRLGIEFLCTYNRIGPRVAFLDDENFGGLVWEKPRDILDISLSKNYRKFNFKLLVGDLFQQDLIQYIVLDRGQRKPDNQGPFGWISNVPSYQKGQDIPYFRYTFGRTIRFAVNWKITT